eukprot:1453427-Pleurochrysis_carterae.AAC.1
MCRGRPVKTLEYNRFADDNAVFFCTASASDELEDDTGTVSQTSPEDLASLPHAHRKVWYGKRMTKLD